MINLSIRKVTVALPRKYSVALHCLHYLPQPSSFSSDSFYSDRVFCSPNDLLIVFSSVVDVFSPVVDVFSTVIDGCSPVVDVFSPVVDVFSPVVDVFSGVPSPLAARGALQFAALSKSIK